MPSLTEIRACKMIRILETFKSWHSMVSKWPKANQISVNLIMLCRQTADWTCLFLIELALITAGRMTAVCCCVGKCRSPSLWRETAVPAKYWWMTEYDPVISLINKSARPWKKSIIYITSASCPWVRLSTRSQWVLSQTCWRNVVNG